MNDLLANSILGICLLIVFGVLMWGVITMGRGGSHSSSSWAGFGDVVIDVGSGTTRTYNIQWQRNNYASYAIVRNCYLFVMEMKPN